MKDVHAGKPVGSLCFCGDGRLASGSYDGRVIWVTDTLAWHPVTSFLKDILSRISGSIATEDSLKNCMSELVAQFPRILCQTVPVIEYSLLHVLVQLGRLREASICITLCREHKAFGGLRATASGKTLTDMAIDTKDRQFIQKLVEYMQSVPMTSLLVRSMVKCMPDLCRLPLFGHLLDSKLQPMTWIQCPDYAENFGTSCLRVVDYCGPMDAGRLKRTVSPEGTPQLHIAVRILRLPGLYE